MKYNQEQLRAAGLWLGATSPFLYIAAQVLAAPLYPGYDWITHLASELGTVGMASSGVFNAAIVLSGVATAVSAVGFKLALERLTASTVVPWLIATSLVSSGFASVWAGLHPLPSPMHNPGYWGAGTIAFPLLLAAALWRSAISIAVRIYLAGAAIAIVAFLIFSSDLAGLDLSLCVGLTQRLGALLVYVPLAVGAATLLRIEGYKPDLRAIQTGDVRSPEHRGRWG